MSARLLSDSYNRRICLAPPDSGHAGVDDDDFSGAIEVEIDIDTPNASGGEPSVEVEEEEPAAQEPPATAQAPGRQPADQPQQPPQAAKPGDEDGGEYSARVKKRIDHLTWRAHEAERRAAELERIAAEQAAQNERLQAGYQQTTDVAAANYERVLTAREQEAKSKWQAAYENGDSEAMFAAAQDAATVAAEKQRFEGWKQQRQQQAAQPPQQQRQPMPQQQAPAQPQPSQKAVAWAQEHGSWFGKDKVMTAAAYAIDADLKAEGYHPESDDYYDELSARVRDNFPHKFQAPTTQAPTTQAPSPAVQHPPARRTSAVAGPTRSTPSGAPAGRRTVTLTASQRQIARNLGLTEAQYAAEVLAMERQQSNGRG